MANDASPAQPAPPRLVSLDALRGFDMFWITGADTIGTTLGKLIGGAAGGGLAAQMDHAAWAGFHFYDLIFPLFIFVAGASVPLSLDRLVGTEGRGAALRRIGRRTLVLYVLGLFYYGGFSTPLSDIRLLGVLQRLALCYGAASLLYLHLRPRGLVAAIVAILAGYWVLLAFVPVPGFGAGDFAEGRNLANWIDAHFLPLAKYDGDHDPEGLLSTLPAAATCLLGMLSSLWLRDTSRSPATRGWALIGAGAALVALGHLWGLQFPVIKKIWTSSFVLVSGGWSCVLLGLFHLVIDVWQVRAWATPFIWVGGNALAIYLATNVADFGKLAERFVGGDITSGLNAVHAGLGDVVLAGGGATMCILFCRFLHNRRIFLRI